MKPYRRNKTRGKLEATMKRLARIHAADLSPKAKAHIADAGRSIRKALKLLKS